MVGTFAVDQLDSLQLPAAFRYNIIMVEYARLSPLFWPRFIPLRLRTRLRGLKIKCSPTTTRTFDGLPDANRADSFLPSHASSTRNPTVLPYYCTEYNFRNNCSFDLFSVTDCSVASTRLNKSKGGAQYCFGNRCSVA